MFSRRKSIAFAVSAAAVAALGLSVYTASADATAAPSYTCTGDGASVPGGTYSSLTIKGNCNVDDGDVHVVNNVTLKPNAALWQIWVGSDLTVGGSVSAGKNTTLVLGCGYGFFCYNVEGVATANIQHDIVTAGANTVQVVFSHIGGSVTQTGGGGGNNANTCEEVNADVSLSVTEPESTYYEDTIGGDVTITGVHTCFLEIYGSSIGQSVTYTGNKTYFSNGNEIEANHIARNLACVGNVPPPVDFGDTNFVAGLATGQCKNMASGITTTTVTVAAPRG